MLACALTALLGAPATVAAASPAAQIAALSAQREADGLPAGIVEVPAWTATVAFARDGSSCVRLAVARWSAR